MWSNLHSDNQYLQHSVLIAVSLAGNLVNQNEENFEVISARTTISAAESVRNFLILPMFLM